VPDYVKLHTEALDSVKIQTLPDSLVRPWMNLLLVSRLHGGILPDIKTICFRLRTDQTTVAGWLSALERAGLIDRSAGERGEISMHDWEFWNPEDRRDQQNAERQRRFRAKKSAFKKENQTEDNPIQPNVTFVTRNVERNVTVEPLRNVTDGMAEWPLLGLQVRKGFPAANDQEVLAVAQDCIQACISMGIPEQDFPDDEDLADAVKLAHFDGQQNVRAYRSRARQVVKTWIDRNKHYESQQKPRTA